MGLPCGGFFLHSIDHRLLHHQQNHDQRLSELGDSVVELIFPFESAFLSKIKPLISMSRVPDFFSGFAGSGWRRSPVSATNRLPLPHAASDRILISLAAADQIIIHLWWILRSLGFVWSQDQSGRRPSSRVFCSHWTLQNTIIID